jgi:cysteine desulfurase
VERIVTAYLDYNASAPIVPSVAETMARVLRDVYGNASSIHQFGQASKARLDEARDDVARLVGAEAGEIVFTCGGTEADNLAIRGAALAQAAAGRTHIVVSAIEHEAVLNTAKALGREGFTVSVIPAGNDGRVDPDAMARAITNTTAIVSLMLANNETGVVQPVQACAEAARAHGAIFHTDAVQAAGKVRLNVRELGADLLSLSAHKFGGPQGVGALWIRKGVALRPHMTGGKQERGRRAGTENVAAIVGMGAAAASISGQSLPSVRVAAQRDRLEAALLATIPDVVVNGAESARVPNTSNISFLGAEGESLVIALDLEGIAVSTGSACSAGTLEPSHVLRGMGLAPARVQSALRFSLGHATTDAEIDHVLAVLPAIVARLRRLTGRRS